ncbi:atypical membrane-integrating protein (Mistic protein) [Bacillus timonensis]|nr:atypical membrane-integrating protein (Mistic protein) [Bacillus timonensis]
MKLKDEDKNSFSEAIDKLNEGLDVVIGLYNDAEEDKPLIVFDEEVMVAIEKAKQTIGEEAITKKINTIIKEVLSFLPDMEDSKEH